MTDPTDRKYAGLVKTAVGPVVGIIATLVSRWLGSSFSQKETIATLKADHSESELSERYEVLKQKYTELQAYVDRHLTKQAIQDKFTFDQITGNLLLGDRHFCSRCFHDGSDPPKQIEMYLKQDQYHCSTCSKPVRTFTMRPK